MNLFIFLPDDSIFLIALFELVKDIATMCLLCKRFNNIIYTNNFWKQKFIYDHGPLEGNIISWLSAYKNYKTVVFGSNKLGQLGLGNTESNTALWGDRQELTPKLGKSENLHNSISLSLKAKAISCGQLHTMIIDLKNNLWAFGENDHGQLGLSDENIRYIPTQIPGIKVKTVSCGYGHTIIIDLNDNVWGFGHNKYGQLGLGDEKDRNIPTRIIFPEKAKAISCGEFHTIIIDLDNNIWSFGRNISGQLGLSDTVNRNIPILIPIKVKSVSSGAYHSIIVDMNDNIWSFGNNTHGQLGLGDKVDRHSPTLITGIKVKAVSLGGFHSIIIDLDYNVFGFGQNEYGQLGLGDDLDRHTPIVVSDVSIPKLIGIKAKIIYSGYLHTMIIDLDDNVYGFGNNIYNQLGLGDTEDRHCPTLIPGIKAQSVACGVAHSIVANFNP